MEWELHLDPPASAAHNMAKDAHCLERARQGGAAALRLYTWDHLVLTVGRAQQVGRELDLAACAAAGIPLVRRITGGRAVLHGTDLTYAVTAPTHLPAFQGGILAIYRTLSGALAHALTALGCAPQVKAYTGRQRAALASAVCFATPSAFEILVGGRKLVGSAQRLLPTAFLQHGSLPLRPQQALLSQLFLDAPEQRLREQMTDLASLGLGAAAEPTAVREALVQAFADELGVRFVPPRWDVADDAAMQALLPQFAPLAAGEGEPPPRRAQACSL